MEQIQMKRSMSKLLTRNATRKSATTNRISDRKKVSEIFRRTIDGLGVTQLHMVLLVSMLSFLFGYCYCYDYCYFVLSNCVDLVYPIELLATKSMDKTYVFLICNGILVVLVKTSGSLINQSRFDLKEHMYIKDIHDALQSEYGDDLVEDEELEIRVDGNEKDVMEIGEESTEELNKKFDEFIRRRKEELRSE